MQAALSKKLNNLLNLRNSQVKPLLVQMRSHRTRSNRVLSNRVLSNKRLSQGKNNHPLLQPQPPALMQEAFLFFYSIYRLW